MRLRLFSVYDTKADAFNTPFACPTNGIAIRHFSDMANNPESSISRHPGDYKLFCVGDFDDSTGRVVSSEPRRAGLRERLRAEALPNSRRFDMADMSEVEVRHRYNFSLFQ